MKRRRKKKLVKKRVKKKVVTKLKTAIRKDKTRGSSEDEKNETELHRVTTAVSRIEPILDTEQGPKPRHYPFVLRIEKTKEYVMELSMDVVEGECIVDDVVVRRRGVNGGSGVEKNRVFGAADQGGFGSNTAPRGFGYDCGRKKRIDGNGTRWVRFGSVHFV